MSSSSSPPSSWGSYLVGDVSQMSVSRQGSSTSFAKEVIRTEDAPLPIGPYSQAIKCGGMVYISGCIGMQASTGQLVTGGVEVEAWEVMKNLKAVVEAAGSHMNKIVKTTVLLKNMSDFQAVNSIYGQFFDPSNPPARACFAVAELPKGALVEIEAICIA